MLLPKQILRRTSSFELRDHSGGSVLGGGGAAARRANYTKRRAESQRLSATSKAVAPEAAAPRGFASAKGPPGGRRSSAANELAALSVGVAKPEVGSSLRKAKAATGDPSWDTALGPITANNFKVVGYGRFP